MTRKQPTTMMVTMYGAAPFAGPIDPYSPQQDDDSALKRALDLIRSSGSNPAVVDAIKEAIQKLTQLRLSQKVGDKEARASIDQVVGLLTVALSSIGAKGF